MNYICFKISFRIIDHNSSFLVFIYQSPIFRAIKYDTGSLNRSNIVARVAPLLNCIIRLPNIGGLSIWFRQSIYIDYVYDP